MNPALRFDYLPLDPQLTKVPNIGGERRRGANFTLQQFVVSEYSWRALLRLSAWS
jgi:hypothetical protein